MIFVGKKDNNNYPTGTSLTNLNFVTNPSFDDMTDWVTPFLQSQEQVYSGNYSLKFFDTISGYIAYQFINVPIGYYKCKLHYYLLDDTYNGTINASIYGTTSDNGTSYDSWESIEFDFISDGNIGTLAIQDLETSKLSVGYLGLIEIYPQSNSEYFCYFIDGCVSKQYIFNDDFKLNNSLFTNSATTSTLDNVQETMQLSYQDISLNELESLKFAIYSKNVALVDESTNEIDIFYFNSKFKANWKDDTLFNITIDLSIGSSSIIQDDSVFNQGLI